MNLINYKNTNIQGNCLIDDGFIPVMDHINEVCVKHDFTCVIIQAKRDPKVKVKGAIVKPSDMSNHYVGHAIDCNLRNNKNGEYFNSTKMGDGKGDDESVIHEFESAMNRWGGRFKTSDSVHFDSGLNIKNPLHWHELNNKYNQK